MKPTIQFYEFLIKCLEQLEKMIEAENVPAIMHPKSQEIVRELLTAIADYEAIIKEELYKVKFWDLVLENDWARKWYYSTPDPKDWDEKEVDGDEEC